MTGFSYHYAVGRYHGQEYRIGVRAEPNIYDYDSFAVVLFYKGDRRQRIEIAKVDDSEHDEGSIHFDRYYRANGAERKDFDVDVESPIEAEHLLRDNWHRYARLYEENHGAG